MNRSQSTIISTILLSGIILGIVTTTYIWGQPLVQKTTDKVKIDSIIDDLTLIKTRIEHTQQTGSPSEVVLNIKEATYRIIELENGLLVRTTTLIPVISSYTYIPISYTELAYETKLTDINTSSTITGLSSTPNGYDGGDIHFSNLTINGFDYNLTVFNTSNTVFDHVCIHKELDIAPEQSNCAEELGVIVKDGIEYTVSWISDDGTEVILSGGEEENIGLLGTDPAGIISGKSQPISRNQQVSLKLSYRTLKDSTGRSYKTFIQCDSNCRASDGIRTLKIERSSVERTADSTNYYIRIYFV